MEDNLYSLINDSIFDINTNKPSNIPLKDLNKNIASEFVSIFINEFLQISQKANNDISESLIDTDKVNFTKKLYINQLAYNIAADENIGIKNSIIQQLKSLELANEKK